MLEGGPSRGHVLADRKKETLEAWFLARGTAWCAEVKSYCADMWDAYHGAAQAYLPNAIPVVESGPLKVALLGARGHRFHIMKNLNDALSKIRRKLQKTLESGPLRGHEATQKEMKGIRWLLVRDPRLPGATALISVQVARCGAMRNVSNWIRCSPIRSS